MILFSYPDTHPLLGTELSWIIGIFGQGFIISGIVTIGVIVLSAEATAGIPQKSTMPPLSSSIVANNLPSGRKTVSWLKEEFFEVPILTA
jgi:hypothetical protein